MANFGAIRSDVYDRVSRSQYYRDNLAGLTAHQRHQRLLAELPGGSVDPQKQRDAAAAVLQSTVSDEDMLRAHHRFLRSAEDDEGGQAASWGARLARRYYARLFKEYAIADLSRYKEAKIGMRWRTKQEVVSGKGQFTCGARGCAEAAGLASYEVNFAYAEAGQHKQALVKLRLCAACAHKLNYRKEKQYRKLGLSALEQHEQQQQQQSRIEEKRQQKRKHKQGHGDGDPSSSPTEHRHHHQQTHRRQQQQQQADDLTGQQHGSKGSKRQRYSLDGDFVGAGAAPVVTAEAIRMSDKSSRGRHVQQEKRSGTRSEEVLGDADIDQFLDGMFGS